MTWPDGFTAGFTAAFAMFWATLWPLVLGFGLSGVVQAFVSKDEMQRVLGDHGPGAIVRASGFGMVSSSCSYAATAMAKSLFAKGADFTRSMAFMIASTNLVLELGIVLTILLGWRFALAEFVGGPIMIVLLAAIGGFVFSKDIVDAARRRLAHVGADGHDHQAMVGVTEERQAQLERARWRDKLQSKAALADAASYAMTDVKMLRRELVIGYLVAGFLEAYVSPQVWHALFFRGHGVWTVLENVVVGPLIAFVSFVCSVGNIPLAAALWWGGISFGGVISFIFADLITFPLVLIYRKYYGTQLTIRLALTFWAVMATAGFAVEGVFSVFGLLPGNVGVNHAKSAVLSVSWNYTTWLNIVFLGVFGAMYWLYRNQKNFGGGDGLALDPVCGMQVATANAPGSAVHRGETVYFCSDRCRAKFDSDNSEAK